MDTHSHIHTSHSWKYFWICWLFSGLKMKVTYSQVWWPILGIRALHLPIQGAHTQQWTHTHREHTPWAVGSHLCCSAGEHLGVRCLAQGHLSRGIESGESAVHSLPTRQSLPDWDLTSQPFDYESDSPTIRPRLPEKNVSHIQIPRYKKIYIKIDSRSQ